MGGELLGSLVRVDLLPPQRCQHKPGLQSQLLLTLPIFCSSEGVCVQGRLNCSLLKSPPPLGSLCIDTWLFFYHYPSMLSDLPCSTSPECPSGEIHTPHSKQALEGLWGPQEFCEYTESHSCSLLAAKQETEQLCQSHQAVLHTKLLAFKELPCPRGSQAAQAP